MKFDFFIHEKYMRTVMHLEQWNVIEQPCYQFNNSFVKPSLKDE